MFGMQEDRPQNPSGVACRQLSMGLILCLIALTAGRLFCAVRVEMLPEEAYYWTYSQHPALSYFDHPPMVAWVIRAGTTLLGNTELGVRIGMIALSLGSSLFLFLTSRIWFGQRVALGATLLFNLLPIFVTMGFLGMTDQPLVFFWLMTLYAISKALHAKRTVYWLIAGLAFGAAMLSKYTAVLLAPSLLLFLLVSAPHRFWLRRPQLWMALGIALLVFSPVIVWNAQHDWASFLFQSARTVGRQPHVLRNVSEFWLVQAGMLTPLVFALYVITVVCGIRRGWIQREDPWIFSMAFSLPLFLVFVLASFKTEVHVNWTAPAFLSLAPGAVAIFLEAIKDPRSQRARRWRVGAWLAFLSCIAVIIFGCSSLVWGFPKIFAYDRVGGWRQLSQEVRTAKNELAARTGEHPFVLGGDRYNLAAELGFYTDQPEECVNDFALDAQGLGFRYWTDLGKFEGRPAIAVLAGEDEKIRPELLAHFDKIDELERIEILTMGKRGRVFYIVSCYGYHAKALVAVERK